MQRGFALVVIFVACCGGFALALPRPQLTVCSAQLVAARPEVADSYVVDFQIALMSTAGGLRATLVNGSDRIDFSSAVENGSELILRLDQYDAALTAHWTSEAHNALEGEYVRKKGTKVTRYRVSVLCGDAGVHAKDNGGANAGSVSGDWQFAFAAKSAAESTKAKASASENEAARFTQEGEHVEGTIAPVSGDYGLLSGNLSGGELHLSRFDGIHALRLDGRVVSGDRLEGVFHVAPGEALNFVGTRATASAGFDEAEHLTTVANPSEAFRFHAVDTSGATVTQDDPRFRGKVVLLDIFGTWCPNCHDEAPVLEGLYAKFHERGLEIVGLSYEYVDDAARSRRLLEIYRGKYSIGFPLLLAGTTDAGEIARTLPQLRNFGAYPTTIFLDRHGRVRLIHAGFSGPATGRLEEVREKFEQTILTLLDEH
jgi:thiol-disulfide isomerase/thioredoxin